VRDVTEIIGLAAALAEHQFEAAGIEHRRAPEIHREAGHHRAGDGEAPIGEARHLAGQL
jgi:hypothetical protein